MSTHASEYSRVRMHWEENMKKNVVYLADADIGGYELIGSGYTPKQAIDCLWNEYKNNWSNWWGDGVPTKKEWLEYHGINEDSCREIEIGKCWRP